MTIDFSRWSYFEGSKRVNAERIAVLLKPFTARNQVSDNKLPKQQQQIVWIDGDRSEFHIEVRGRLPTCMWRAVRLFFQNLFATNPVTADIRKIHAFLVADAPGRGDGDAHSFQDKRACLQTTCKKIRTWCKPPSPDLPVLKVFSSSVLPPSPSVSSPISASPVSASTERQRKFPSDLPALPFFSSSALLQPPSVSSPVTAPVEGVSKITPQESQKELEVIFTRLEEELKGLSLRWHGKTSWQRVVFQDEAFLCWLQQQSPNLAITYIRRIGPKHVIVDQQPGQINLWTLFRCGLLDNDLQYLLTAAPCYQQLMPVPGFDWPGTREGLGVDATKPSKEPANKRVYDDTYLKEVKERWLPLLQRLLTHLQDNAGVSAVPTLPEYMVSLNSASVQHLRTLICQLLKEKRIYYFNSKEFEQSPMELRRQALSTLADIGHLLRCRKTLGDILNDSLFSHVLDAAHLMALLYYTYCDDEQEKKIQQAYELRLEAAIRGPIKRGEAADAVRPPDPKRAWEIGEQTFHMLMYQAESDASGASADEREAIRIRLFQVLRVMYQEKTDIGPSIKQYVEDRGIGGEMEVVDETEKLQKPDPYEFPLFIPVAESSLKTDAQVVKPWDSCSDDPYPAAMKQTADAIELLQKDAGYSGLRNYDLFWCEETDGQGASRFSLLQLMSRYNDRMAVDSSEKGGIDYDSTTNRPILSSGTVYSIPCFASHELCESLIVGTPTRDEKDSETLLMWCYYNLLALLTRRYSPTGNRPLLLRLLGLSKGWSPEASRQAAYCAFCLYQQKRPTQGHGALKDSFDKVIIFPGYESLQQPLVQPSDDDPLWSLSIPQCMNDQSKTFAHLLTQCMGQNKQGPNTYGFAALAGIAPPDLSSSTLRITEHSDMSTEHSDMSTERTGAEPLPLALVESASVQLTTSDQQTTALTQLYAHLATLLPRDGARTITAFTGYNGEKLTLWRLNDQIQIHIDLKRGEFWEVDKRLTLLGLQHKSGASKPWLTGVVAAATSLLKLQGPEPVPEETPDDPAVVITLKSDGTRTYNTPGCVPLERLPEYGAYADADPEQRKEHLKDNLENLITSMCQLFLSHFVVKTFDMWPEGQANPEVLLKQLVRGVTPFMHAFPEGKPRSLQNAFLCSQDSCFEITGSSLPETSLKELALREGFVVRLKKQTLSLGAGERRGGEATRELTVIWGTECNGDQYVEVILMKSDHVRVLTDQSFTKHEMTSIRANISPSGNTTVKYYKAIQESSYSGFAIAMGDRGYYASLKEQTQEDLSHPDVQESYQYIFQALSNACALLVSRDTVVDGKYYVDGSPCSDQKILTHELFCQGPTQRDAALHGADDYRKNTLSGGDLLIHYAKASAESAARAQNKNLGWSVHMSDLFASPILPVIAGAAGGGRLALPAPPKPGAAAGK